MANGSNQKQIVDFNKLRKRRQRFTTAKRVIILAAVAALLLGAVFLNNLLVQENITTRISDVVSGFGGSGYPVPLPGGVIKYVESIGDNLAVLNDANLYVYNSGGKQVANFQQMNDSTVLVIGGNRMLTYDANFKKYAIHSRSRTLEEQTLEYSIVTADINERGDYAIVSSARQYICAINVYNKRFEPIFVSSIVEDDVLSVSLSPKGNMMATGWINTRDGMLYSGVDIYRLSTDQEPVRYEIPDNLVLDVQYQEEDRIAVLTYDQYLVLSSDGKVKYSYSFGGLDLKAIEQEGRQTLLLLEDRDSRTREVVLLDGDLSEKAVLTTADKITDLQLASRRVYLLGEESVLTYDHTLELLEEQPVQQATRIHLCGGRVYYMTREEIRVLGQAEQDDGLEEDLYEYDGDYYDDQDDDWLTGEDGEEEPETPVEESQEGEVSS